MSSVKTKPFYTGVTLEPEVVNYLDGLTERIGMNRSWVLNAIVQEYARFVEAKGKSNGTGPGRVQNTVEVIADHPSLQDGGTRGLTPRGYQG